MARILCIGTSHTQSGHNYRPLRNDLEEKSRQQFWKSGNSFYTGQDATEYFFKTWPGMLEEITNHEVFNLGVSGIGISGILPRIVHAMTDLTPDLVIFEIPPITRYTLWPDEIIEYGTDIYNVSHVITSQGFHACDTCLLASTVIPVTDFNDHRNFKNIFGSEKNFNSFRDSWLMGIGCFDTYSLISTVKLIQSYVTSNGSKFVAYEFASDGSSANINYTDLLDKFDISTFVDDNNEIVRLRKSIEAANMWQYSNDNTGHANDVTERWFVENIFVPYVNKVL